MSATVLTPPGVWLGFWRVETEALPFLFMGASLILIFVLMFRRRKSPW
jgi:LPXTG-motif cell wall-anchored protein